MFDLVNDAEADEGQEGEVTGEQMVDGAVARARRDFGAQPQLQGELLGELGRMYIRLGAVEAAEPVLADALVLLERHAPPDDAALNKARVSLATALLATSDDVAEDSKSRGAGPRRLAPATRSNAQRSRAYASAILSQLAFESGQPAGCAHRDAARRRGCRAWIRR